MQKLRQSQEKECYYDTLGIAPEAWLKWSRVGEGLWEVMGTKISLSGKKMFTFLLSSCAMHKMS